MIQRIIFGLIVGIVYESFKASSFEIQRFIMYIVAGVFIFNSFTYGCVYGLMAITEIAFGFIGSGWFRVMRERYGW